MSFDEKRDTKIYDLIEKALDLQWQRISELDQKAASLAGFEGVIIGFVLGNASLLQARIAGNCILVYTFIGAVLALIASFVLAIRGFMVRRWQFAPDPDSLIRGYANSSYEKLLLAVGGEMAKAQAQIRLANETKAKQVRLSSYFMLAGLVLAFIFVLYSIALG